MTDYEKGYSVGIDAVELMGKELEAGPQGAAGVLTAIMSAIYFCAKGDQETVDFIIDHAQHIAKQENQLVA